MLKWQIGELASDEQTKEKIKADPHHQPTPPAPPNRQQLPAQKQLAEQAAAAAGAEQLHLLLKTNRHLG